jgi:O-antigen ligase
VNNFINQNVAYDTIIDIPFFLNVLVFIVLCNSAIIDENIILKGLLVFSLSSFFLAILFLLGLGEVNLLEGRMSIFGMNENRLGLTACISILILISIVFENKLVLKKRRYALLILTPFLLGLTLQTGSRSAFISLILGLGTYFFLNNKLKHIYKIMVFLTFGFFMILIWEFFLKDTYIITRLFQSINEGDLSSRDLIWREIFKLIADDPILGVGETGYSQKMMNFSDFDNIPSPHNVFIEVFCYTGFIGLAVFLVFYKKIINNAIKVKIYKNEVLPFILLIPITINLLSGQLFDFKLLWVLLAFIVSRAFYIKKIKKNINFSN